MSNSESQMSAILTKAENARDELERITVFQKSVMEDVESMTAEKISGILENIIDRMNDLYNDMDVLCSEIQDFRDTEELPF